MKPYVLVIGSSNTDLSIYLPKFPEVGETVTNGQLKQNLGGKGANQAVASRKSAGANTIFIGKIGTDKFGDTMLTQLNNQHINTAHVFRDSKEKSGIALIMINKEGENKIGVAPGANKLLTPHEVEEKADIIRNASVILVQMEIPIKTIQRIFEIASASDALKILNPAPLTTLPIDLLKKIDIITPNEGELLQIYEKLQTTPVKISDTFKNLKTVSQTIVKKTNLKYVITTLGAKGSFIFERDTSNFTRIPALEVNSIDTVGAGDTFNGVLAGRLANDNSRDIIDAIRYANTAAGLAVTKKGAQDSIPDLSEVTKNLLDI